MPRLGAHMSIEAGLHLAVERGSSIGCEAIQVFTRNASRWKAKKRTPEELDLYRQALARTGIHPVVAHAIYLINLASPEDTVRAMSNDAFREELGRCHEAGIPYLVIHPGSHKGSGLELGITRIAQGVREAYAEHPEYTVITLLENTAGQGDTIGRTLEELAQLAAQIGEPSRIGYCFDTAHALASGYELRTREGYEQTLARFDQVLGLDKLYCFHLNDSKYNLGEERDRHQQIGQGYLGIEAFRMLLNDPRFAALPMLLETPKSEDMHEDVENLALLRSLMPAAAS
jgi:deoxyribonuclease IV